MQTYSVSTATHCQNLGQETYLHTSLEVWVVVTKGGGGEVGKEADKEERPTQLPLRAHYASRRHCGEN